MEPEVASAMIFGRSPFNPSFGSQPPYLAGRDDLVDRIVRDFDEVKPTNAAFGRILVGDRGIGKTVLLDVIGDKLADRGWFVVHYQAAGRQDVLVGLAKEIRRKLREASKVKSMWAALSKEFEVSVGPSFARVTGRLSSKDAESADDAQDLLFETLLTVGQCAKSDGFRVLITIDEAHVLQHDEDYQAIGACLQRLVRRNEYQLPLAPLIAGISTLTRRIAQSKATFLQRLKSENVALIDRDASRLALLVPISERRVLIKPDALDFLVSRGNGYPYYLQLLGEGSWDASEGAQQIELSHAEHGAEVALKNLETVLSSRWDGLSASEQRYLSAMARHDESVVETGYLARTMGKASTTDTGYIRDALINEHHLIRQAAHGTVEFALPEFRDWLRGHLDGSEPPKLRARGTRRS
jgi:AAA ATPase-like protein